MAKEKFLFSVVIPVYNVEEYLRETIESVLAQDIGFQQNIQMILVNDGSPDNSEKICLEYQKLYPDNIIYVKQDNAGVSAARNHGMEYVEGKYVNFLDSDDKWSADAFSEVYRFFEEHQEEINLVSCKQQFFEAADGLHPLSKGKFTTDRVIDILDEYDKIQFHITATILKASAMRIATFCEDMHYGEDARYVTELILDKCKYGVVAKPTHYYRKRRQNNSAVQGKEKALEWYMDTPKKFYRYLTETSIKKMGIVIPYIQYAMCYDIQWRLNNRIGQVLSEEQQKEYLVYIRELLLACADDIILAQKGIDLTKKFYLLSLKYGENQQTQVVHIDHNLIWNHITVFNLEKDVFFRIDVLNGKNGNLILSGRINSCFAGQMTFSIRDNEGNIYPLFARYVRHTGNEMWKLEGYMEYIYDVQIPIRASASYEICGVYDGKYPFKPRVVCGKFARMYDKCLHAYTIIDGYTITKSQNVLYSSVESQRKLEKRYVKDLKNRIKTTTSDKTRNDIEEAIRYRKAYFYHRRIHKKKIWLIMDRIHVAGDNAEVFFEYMEEHPDKEIETYFVISKKSKDYHRMQKYGKVIEYGSRKHKLYTLLADKIISSQGEDNIYNPFLETYLYVRDLCHFDYVFLQHGIIKDDLSSWLNKYKKNIAMFVTSAWPEWKSVLDAPYYYDEKVVLMTGLPRYDRLIQNEKNKKVIVFMPTWRQELSITDAKTGEQCYNTEFKNSDYFQFYNKLINDERLIKTMKKYGYSGKFCIHSKLFANVKDFNSNEVIEVSTENVDYQKEFVEDALLVTDYSSVAFDFAYLKKPVVYIQWDKKAFYSGAVYDQGYFDYDEMGFGPVCENYERAVDTIVSIIESDCKISDYYQKRRNDFYGHFDQNNCRRVYEAIKKL